MLMFDRSMSRATRKIPKRRIKSARSAVNIREEPVEEPAYVVEVEPPTQDHLKEQAVDEVDVSNGDLEETTVTLTQEDLQWLRTKKTGWPKKF